MTVPSHSDDIGIAECKELNGDCKEETHDDKNVIRNMLDDDLLAGPSSTVEIGEGVSGDFPPAPGTESEQSTDGDAPAAD